MEGMNLVPKRLSTGDRVLGVPVDTEPFSSYYRAESGIISGLVRMTDRSGRGRLEQAT
jgi:hypothetical protein